MNLSNFDFDLPLELIAQEPLEYRDQSNLIISSEDNKIVKFSDIIDYLNNLDRRFKPPKCRFEMLV